MPEQDQTLPLAGDLGQLDRWLSIQPILDEVFTEREAQIEQWGDGDVPLGFGSHDYQMAASFYKSLNDQANQHGDIDLGTIFLEEVYEALAEGDEAKARDELIQAVAVGIKAIQQIDRNAARKAAADASA